MALSCEFDLQINSPLSRIITNCPANSLIERNFDLFDNTYTVEDVFADQSLTKVDSIDVSRIIQTPTAGTVFTRNSTGDTTITVEFFVVSPDQSDTSQALSCSFDYHISSPDLPKVNNCPTADITASFDPVTKQYIIPNLISSENLSLVVGTDTNLIQTPNAGTVLSRPASGILDVDMSIQVQNTANVTSTISVCDFKLVLSDPAVVVNTSPPSTIYKVFNTTDCEYDIEDFTSGFNIDNDAQYTKSQTPITSTTILGTSTGIYTETIQYFTQLTGTSNTPINIPQTTNLIIEDKTNPIVSCPPTTEIEDVNNTCSSTITDYTTVTTASDNCTNTLTITQSKAPGTSLSIGRHLLEMTTSDGKGNTGACNFDIIIKDITPPDVSLSPTTVTEQLDANCDFSLLDYTSFLSINDACSATVTTVQTPAKDHLVEVRSFPFLQQDVNFTVKDESLNETTKTLVVQFEDKIDPTLVCPSNQTHYTSKTDCFYSVEDYTSLASSVLDNCTTPTISQIPTLGDQLSIGIHTVTLTATDLSLNTGSCTFTINILDTVAPNITCPDTITKQLSSTNCNYVLEDLRGSAIVSDYCSPVSKTQDVALGFTYTTYGVYPLNITATDQVGNDSTCLINLKIVDVTPPVFTNCSTDTIIKHADQNCEYVVLDYTSFMRVEDKCDNNLKSYTQLPLAGQKIGLGITEIELIATDQSNKSATCKVVLNVLDTISPKITQCIPPQNKFTTSTSCTYLFEDLSSQATVIEKCTSPSLLKYEYFDNSNQKVNVNDPLQLGTNTLTMKVSDEAGYFSTCQFDIHVTDNVNPIIICPQDTVLGTQADQCSVVLGELVTRFDFQFEDNCTDSLSLLGTFSQNFSVNTQIVRSSSITMAVTVTDNASNVGTCQFDVSVQDLTPPEITCPVDTTKRYADVNCRFSIEDYTSLAAVVENCTYTVNQVSIGNSVSYGFHNIELVAVDNSNLKDTCSFVLEVIDTLAPEVSCIQPTLTVGSDVNCDYTLKDFRKNALFTDGCGIKDTLQNPVKGTVFSGVGNHDIYIIGVDESGNKDSCSFVLAIADTIAPVITQCANDDVVYTEDFTCQSPVISYTDSVNFTENCTSDAFIYANAEQSPVVGAPLNLGNNPITITIKDEANLVHSCVFNIEVKDTTAPKLIHCPADTTMSTDQFCQYTMIDYKTRKGIEFEDNCIGAINLSQNIAIGTLTSGTQTIEITAKDNFNNTSRDTCKFKVVTIDVLPPTFEFSVKSTTVPGKNRCFSDTTISTQVTNCEYFLQDYTQLITTDSIKDNCSVFSDLIFSQTPSVGKSFTPQVTPYTIWIKAEDANNNIDSCSFEITVQDLIKPKVVCPQNDTIYSTSTDCQIEVPDYGNELIYSDNCQSNTNLMITQTISVGSKLLSNTINPIQLTVSDGVQDSTCSFNLIVLDTISPMVQDCPTKADTSYVDLNCSATILDFKDMYQSVFSDACNVISIQQTVMMNNIIMTGTTGIGEHDITLEAQDPSGNTSFCKMKWVVLDTISPKINADICPQRETIYATDNCEIVLKDYTSVLENEVSDNCTSESEVEKNISQFPLENEVFTTDSVEVTLSVNDESNNFTSCSFYVVKIDTTSPQLTCPDTLRFSVDSTCNYKVVSYENRPEIKISDNCSKLFTYTQTGTKLIGNMLSADDIETINIEFKDENENTKGCSFILSIVDYIAPVFINCPDDNTIILYRDSLCDALVPDIENTLGLTYKDNCTSIQDLSLSKRQYPTSLIPISQNEQGYFSITDKYNNTTKCVFNLELVDTIKPTITCPSNVDPQCESTIDYSLPTVRDNCDGGLHAQLIHGLSIGSKSVEEGVNRILYEAVDLSGNSDTCSFTIEILPKVSPAEILFITPELEACDSVTIFEFEANPFDSFRDVKGLWNITDGEASISDSLNHEMILTTGVSEEVTLEWILFGKYCDTSRHEIIITRKECDKFILDVPTGITPNGDHVNDTWQIENSEDYPNIEVFIYNRWGSLIFESKGYLTPWDGTYNGKPVPAGSYYYLIKTNYKVEKPQKGIITIIK